MRQPLLFHSGLKNRSSLAFAMLLVGTLAFGGLAYVSQQSLHAGFQELKTIQTDSLSRRQLHADQFEKRTQFLEASMGLAGFALLMLASGFLRAEQRKSSSAARELVTFNSTLESAVDRRTGELSVALARISRFAQELSQGAEDERRRIAREVHDQLGQIFTALKMLVMGLRMRPERDLTEDAVRELSELLDEGEKASRDIVSQLRPPLLDDLGLGAAVKLHARELARSTEIEFGVDIRDDNVLDKNQSSQLFCIVQEALANVLLHSGARHARVSAVATTGGTTGAGGYRVKIVDDGHGPTDVKADTRGLRNMSERAKMMGGSFSFGPAGESGTVVIVIIPFALSPMRPFA